MLEKEKLIKSKTIYKGRIVTLKEEVVLTQSKNEAKREIVLHSGGVGIVCLDKDFNICLVRQYRRPFDDFVIEIPAGKLEGDEDKLLAAKRELKEETGYSAKKIVYMGESLASPGFCTESVHLYLATELEEGECCPDEDEFLDVFKVSLKEAVNMVMTGEITDGKTAVAILKANEILK